jgi:phenylacetate-CoA ligase
MLALQVTGAEVNRFAKKLYHFAPISIQNMLVSLYGKKLLRQRYGRPYRDALAVFRGRAYDSIEEMNELQISELRSLFAHAKTSSRLYADLYEGIGLDDLNTIDDIRKLPIVEKEFLRANIEDAYTIRPERGVASFTGGTTGKSLMVFYRPEDVQRRMAYLDAFKERCGVDTFTAKKATFSGRSFCEGIFQTGRKIFWRDNRSYNQRLYSTFDLKKENLHAYVKDLCKYKPEVINGFPSALTIVAEFILRNGVDLGFSPKAIFTTSETLLPAHRAVIEQAFGSRVYNQYASAEGAPFITECKHGNLHYCMDTGIIEQVDLGLGAEMLVTSFTSYGTPLIRYRIGDGVVFGTEKCPCGSCLPIVERIDGRAVDFLYSPTRGRISLSHLADVIKGLPNCVIAMQFVQISISVITVLVVADASSYDNAAEKSILDEMRYRFGGSMEIRVELVDEIPLEASGKARIIKNKIPTKDLETLGAT